MTTWTVYCNGFWPGFLEGTDPVTVGVFLDLLSRALDGPVEITHHPDTADILLESLFGPSILGQRRWPVSIFFSGECRICPNYRDYDCVLWGEATQGNVVCCPEFVPYLYSTGLLPSLEKVSQVSHAYASQAAVVATKPRVCVIISNPGGQERNRFLDILERYVQVDYAGRYRNNVPNVTAPYTSGAFREFIGQYRCVLAMENSRGGDYVTEKITHGLLAGTVPIYWGARRVADYFNPERFIHVHELDEAGIGAAVGEILAVIHNDDAYVHRVSQPVFMDAPGIPGHELGRTLDAIARDMRALLQKSHKDK